MLDASPLFTEKRFYREHRREIFKACPEVKKYLWGGKFWSEGYFVSTVGAHGNEQMIQNYVQQQGSTDENGQLKLF